MFFCSSFAYQTGPYLKSQKLLINMSFAEQILILRSRRILSLYVLVRQICYPFLGKFPVW